MVCMANGNGITNGGALPFTPSAGETPIPTPPLDIPVPDIPPANFQAIGSQVAQGANQGGFWSGLFDALFSWLPKLIARILGILMGATLTVVAFLLKLLLSGLDNAQYGIDQVASTAVEGITGVQVNTGGWTTIGNAAARQADMNNIASALLQGIVGDYTSGATQNLGPSDAGAKRYFGISTKIAVEGWLQEFLGECLPVLHVDKLGGLKDALEGTWGLSRLARRAWAAPVKVLIEDPFTWLMNQTFTPAKVPVETMIRELIRASDTSIDWKGELAMLGFGADKIDALVNYNKLHAPVAGIVTLLEHGQLDFPTATALLQAQGYDSTTAGYLVQIEQTNKASALAMELVKKAIEQWGAGQLTQDQRDQVIQNPFGTSTGIVYEGDLGGQSTSYALSPAERAYVQVLISLTNQKAAKTRMLSISEAAKLVEQGIWGLDQFRDLVLAKGYTPDDEQDLELLTLLESKKLADAAAAKAAAAKSKAAAATAKAAAAKAAAEAKGVGVAKFESLVAGGEKTIADYQAFLTAKGVAADNVTALTAALQAKLGKAAATSSAAGSAGAAAKAKALNVAQLETAVTDGLITLADFTGRLRTGGLDDGDAAVLTEELQQKIDAATAKHNALAEAKASAAIKHVNLSQEQRSVLLGVQTANQYQQFLSAHGFASEDIAVLMSDIQAQLAKTTTAKAATPGATSAAAAKGINLTTLAKLVRAGVKQPSDYAAAVIAAGYSPADAQAMESYLNLQMEQDQQTLAAKGRASALPTQRLLSVTELEKLAKAGVVPAATYTQSLVASGVSAADAQTLTLALASGIKSSTAAAANGPTTAATLKAKGLSLAGLEADTVAAKLTVAQLTSILAGNGITQDQIDQVAGLVQDQIDNKAAVAKLEADAGARAAAKGLNLGQETAAVKQGVQTIGQYQAFVAGLGYDPADTAVLVGTLSAELAKTAAKAGGSQATPAPSPPGESPQANP